jgi:hypothetical protein
MAIHDLAWTICLCAALALVPAGTALAAVAAGVHAQEGAADEGTNGGGSGAEEQLPRTADPASDTPEQPALSPREQPAPPPREPRAIRARRRTQAFLLPLDEAARAAAGRVAQGATQAMLSSADEMIDLSLPLAAEGPQGAASLNSTVADAVAEAERGEPGPSLRRLAARFSLDRVLVGSVALRGPSVAVLLTLADAPRARLLGREALLLPAAATGADGVEAQVQGAVRRLLDRAALDDAASAPIPPSAEGKCPGPRPHDVPASTPPEAASPEAASAQEATATRAADSTATEGNERHAWKRGLLDKTGTEGWDVPESR